MRPVTLRISAFGPYAGEQVVDFRELGDKRFFLIHGPTGSGKTSVLDAMTFALYGATTGDERSGKDMRSLFASPDVATQVRFDFAVGTEGYRIWRRPEQLRPKQRGDGFTTDKPDAALWRRSVVSSDAEDGELLASGVRDVDARIKKLLGFDCDQFRQVVVLPQGRFREVLSADVKAREEILKQLFKTERFAGVTEFLKARRNEARAAIKSAYDERAGVLKNEGVESREQLAELVDSARAQAQEARVAHEAAQVTAEASRATLETARSAHAAHREAAEAGETLAQLTQRASEIEAKRVELADARRAQAVLAAFDARDGAAKELAQATSEHESRLAALPELERVSELACERAAAAEAATTEEQQIERMAVLAEQAARQVADATRLEKLRAVAHKAATALDKALEDEKRAAKGVAAASAELSGAEDRWRSGTAAALAGALEPGAPCPVCGSTEHPHPAVAAGATSEEELDSVRAAERAALAAVATATERVAASRTKLSEAREAVSAEETALGAELAGADSAKLTAEADRIASELAARRAAVQKAADDLVACRDVREQAKTELAAGRERVSAAAERLARATQTHQDAATALASVLAAANFDDEAQALRVKRAPAELDALEGVIGAYERDLAAAKDRDERARAAIEGVAAPADLIGLEQAEAAARSAAADAGTLAGTALNALSERETSLKAVDAYDAQSASLTARFDVLASLADVADGSNDLKLSFQRYVLGTYLDEVLAHANYRFQRMTGGRYRLMRFSAVEHRGRPAGLALSVFDEEAGESRPAGTLSGGEGFLASLALALGLAEAVQAHAGGVKLETVFIDEGFGTLDAEALELAMTTLLDLAGVAAEQGRLVGIISHVDELQQRVDARLEIVHHERGSSARFVV